MREPNIKSNTHLHGLWVIPMVFLLAQQSHALGLGEMRIQSYLGEPLRAQVDLSDLGGEYESSLKVKLASPETYRKAGLAYPYEKKYSFEVVNTDGRHPRVKVSSLRAIEDPFLNILIEVHSPNGTIIKNYTVLIDPSPDYYRNQASVTVMPAAESAVANVAATAPQAVPPVAVVAPASTPVPTGQRHNQASKPATPRPLARTSSTRAKTAAPRARPVAPRNDGEPGFGKLSLSLSTSLSISNYDPNVPLSAKEANDALQEELIAKEKTLKELNAQISEMETLIKGLQIKLSMTASSAVPSSGVIAESAVTAMAQSAPVAAIPAVSEVALVPVQTPLAEPQPGLMEVLMTRLKDRIGQLLAGLAVVAMGAGGYYWWRKRKLQRGWIPGGLFDDLAGPPVGEAAAAVASVAAPAAPAAAKVTPVATPAPAVPNKVAVQKLAVGEQSMKVPAFKEQKAPSTLPPEYDLLEEANIYLRFGHDKLAEEVLHDALKINPKNPDIYMTLLGIYDTRNDAQGFEKLAKEFKVIADEATWQKVAEMGRKLDIGNTFYSE